MSIGHAQPVGQGQGRRQGRYESTAAGVAALRAEWSPISALAWVRGLVPQIEAREA